VARPERWEPSHCALADRSLCAAGQGACQAQAQGQARGASGRALAARHGVVRVHPDGLFLPVLRLVHGAGGAVVRARDHRQVAGWLHLHLGVPEHHPGPAQDRAGHPVHGLRRVLARAVRRAPSFPPPRQLRACHALPCTPAIIIIIISCRPPSCAGRYYEFMEFLPFDISFLMEEGE
jgi:hypothetical protein